MRKTFHLRSQQMAENYLQFFRERETFHNVKGEITVLDYDDPKDRLFALDVAFEWSPQCFTDGWVAVVL